MKKRKLMISVLSILSSFYLFSGCTQKEMNNAANDIGATVEDGVNKAVDGVENGINNVTDWFSTINFDDMAYNKSELKSVIENKGYKVTVSPMGKGYFTVDYDKYILDIGEFQVYEYTSEQKENIVTDLRTITKDGMVINGQKISWSSKPHYYKKGRIIVIYDGDNKDMLSLLENILGAPFIGNKPS